MAFRGQHDDRNVAGRRIFLQQPQRAEAVEAGHHHVQHDELRLGGEGGSQRFSAIAATDDFVAAFFESHLQRAEHIDLVVRDENFLGGGRIHSWCLMITKVWSSISNALPRNSASRSSSNCRALSASRAGAAASVKSWCKFFSPSSSPAAFRVSLKPSV